MVVVMATVSVIIFLAEIHTQTHTHTHTHTLSLIEKGERRKTYICFPYTSFMQHTFSHSESHKPKTRFYFHGHDLVNKDLNTQGC